MKTGFFVDFIHNFVVEEKDKNLVKCKDKLIVKFLDTLKVEIT